MQKVEVAVTHVFLCPFDTDDARSNEVDQLNVKHFGIDDDRHEGPMMVAGGRQKDYATRGTLLPNLRQVSIIDEAELAAIAGGMEIEGITGSDVGANIVLRGVPALTSFPAGVNGMLKFPSGALLYCMGENEPCDGPGKAIATRLDRPELANKFQKAAMHRRGIVALVGRSGIIRRGDTVELFWPAWTKWSPYKIT